MLEEYGWEGVTTPLGSATGLCVPMELENFVYVSSVIPLSAILCPLAQLAEG